MIEEMVSPSKCLKYIRMHSPQLQSLYLDINPHILESAMKYQLLTLDYLIEFVPIPNILESENNEIGLVAPGDSCFTHVN